MTGDEVYSLTAEFLLPSSERYGDRGDGGRLL